MLNYANASFQQHNITKIFKNGKGKREQKYQKRALPVASVAMISVRYFETICINLFFYKWHRQDAIPSPTHPF